MFFFSLISSIFKKKKRDKSKFSWLFMQLFNKIQPNMSEQEEKRQRIYDWLNAETKPNFLCLLYTKQRKFFFFLQKNAF